MRERLIVSDTTALMKLKLGTDNTLDSIELKLQGTAENSSNN